MAASTALRPTGARTSASLWLAVATAWHATLAVIAAAAAVWLIGLNLTAPTPAWVKWVGVILAVVEAVGSAFAVLYLTRRQHRGRVLSLTVNYLGLVGCGLAALQVLGVFVGVDALADSFGRGVPFLLLVLAGYLVSAVSDRFEHNPARAALFQRAGYAVMALAFVVFLLRVGLLSGLLSLGQRLAAPLPLALALGAAVFGFMLWVVWQAPVALALGAHTGHDEMISGWLFLSPNLLGFLIFFAGPLVLSFAVSFTNSDAFGTQDWVGLQNYLDIITLTVRRLAAPDQPAREVLDIRRFSEMARLTLFGQSWLLGATDKLFWIALRNTLQFVLLAVPLSVVPALLLSNVLNSKIPGMKFYRAVYFMPSIAAVVGISLVWQWLYNATVGYINYGIASTINLINVLPGLELADPQIRWLSQTNTALLSVILVAAWQTVGFNTVLFLAGLQNIPGVLYEAATVDGAGRLAKFWNVTLPLLAPTTFFVVTTSTIQAMQVFEQVFILMNPPEGPNNATLTIVLYLYRSGFQNFKQGYGSAIAWVLFILIFALTLLQFQRQRSTSGGYDV